MKSISEALRTLFSTVKSHGNTELKETENTDECDNEDRGAIELFDEYLPSRRARTAIVAAILAVMFGLLVDSAFRRTAVSDEPYDFICGLSYWWTGSAKLSYSHPPLANALVSIPSALFFPKDDLTRYKGWEECKVERLSKMYLSKHYQTGGRAQLLLDRIVMSLLSVTFALYAFLLSRRYWGYWSGVAVLALLALNPTLLAHGRFMTTDMPMTFATVLMLGEFLYFIQNTNRIGLLRVAGAVSIGVLTKYTALPLVFFFGALGLFFVFRGCGRYRQKALSERARAFFLHILLIGLMVILSINLVYKFDRSFLSVEAILNEPEPQHSVTSKYNHQMLEETLLSELPSGLRIPLPYTYVFGVLSVVKHCEKGHSSWFMGKKTREGSPLYFPTLILTKTPVIYWVLLIGGGVWLFFNRKRLSTLSGVTMVAIVFFMMMIVPAKMNIGVRHALPVIPLLALMAGRSLVRILDYCATDGVNRWTAGLLRCACYLSFVLLIVGIFTNYPDFLGYFNTAIGREVGHEISIVGEDWGQDELALIDYIKKRDMKPLYYRPASLGGVLEMKRQKVRYKRIICKTLRRNPPKEPVYMAIHANTLARRACLPKTGEVTEIDRINEHIVIMRYRPE